MDLLDHYRGKLSTRRLRVLIQHLPRDSALVRSIHGEESEWGLTQHLLAATVDQLAAGNWLFAAAHTPENADPPERPQPIPRPGLDSAEPTTSAAASPAQIAVFFGQPSQGSR